MTDRQELAQWLAETATGSQSAFKELYDATSPQLYSLLLRILRNPDSAQDVLQDAYVKIWQKAGSYTPERGAPLTWLLSIARYSALDRLRRKRPEVTLPDDPELEAALLADEKGQNPSRANEDLQTLGAVQTCLKTLEAKQRNSVLLAYYEGLTHEELSARLDAPLGTVKSWVRRGLSRLRDCLAEVL